VIYGGKKEKKGEVREEHVPAVLSGKETGGGAKSGRMGNCAARTQPQE